MRVTRVEIRNIYIFSGNLNGRCHLGGCRRRCVVG
jgi:hypothetical protein